MVTAGKDRAGKSLLNLLLGLNVKEGVVICWRLKSIVNNDTEEGLWGKGSQLRLVGVHDEVSSTLSIIIQADLQAW